MNLLSVNEIKNLLDKYDSSPSKTMGQNFLIDDFTLNKIIEAAELNPKDTILEIGPGLGGLTKELAQKTKKIIAIEKDNAMVQILKETLKDYKNVEIIHGNALLDTNYSLPTHYKVVANIPYYITSPIIRKFLESANPPESMVLMVQKEVGQRICSSPPNMSLLSVSVQFYAKPKIISYISKKCFWPSPKVDSAIIKIIPFKKSEEISHEKFFKIVKSGFSQPRKQLANNFSKSLKIHREKVNLWLLKNTTNPKQRAETLSIEDWKNLANSYQHP